MDGDIVRDGRVVIASRGLGFKVAKGLIEGLRRERYIMIGMGERSAIAVYQDMRPSCVTAGAK